VDLALKAGELSLIVGPSGCGKTTLISIIAGLLDPTHGTVSVLGTELSRLGGRGLVEFRARNVGFVFQQYNLLPALTAAENAAVPLVITGWRRSKAVARAKEVLAAVGLENRANAFPSQLSGGQLQRVVLARALLSDAEVLVLVEPTSAVDAHTEARIAERLREARAGRTTVIATTSPLLLDRADHVVLLEGGRVVAEGTHRALLREHMRYRDVVTRGEEL
jgi:putative ABC transport system ATP-binding protein